MSSYYQPVQQVHSPDIYSCYWRVLSKAWTLHSPPSNQLVPITMSISPGSSHHISRLHPPPTPSSPPPSSFFDEFNSCPFLPRCHLVIPHLSAIKIWIIEQATTIPGNSSTVTLTNSMYLTLFSFNTPYHQHFSPPWYAQKMGWPSSRLKGSAPFSPHDGDIFFSSILRELYFRSHNCNMGLFSLLWFTHMQWTYIWKTRNISASKRQIRDQIREIVSKNLMKDHGEIIEKGRNSPVHHQTV